MNEPEPIDVTSVMNAEVDLTDALRDWANAGAPVIDVVAAIATLIDEKIELARRDALMKAGEQPGHHCGKLRAECDDEFCPTHGRDIR